MTNQERWAQTRTTVLETVTKFPGEHQHILSQYLVDEYGHTIYLWNGVINTLKNLGEIKREDDKLYPITN